MATYVLDKGNNYHVFELDDGYEVTFTSGNKLMSQVVRDLPKTATEVTYCDEKIPLHDGKYLTRVRDSLTISEE